MPETLTERALRLKYSAGRLINSPTALLIPLPVRELVAELAALVADLAAAVDRKGN